jgi:hypothetical protein
MALGVYSVPSSCSGSESMSPLDVSIMCKKFGLEFLSGRERLSHFGCFIIDRNKRSSSSSSNIGTRSSSDT